MNKEGPIADAAPRLGPCWIWEGTRGQRGLYGYHYQGETESPRIIGAHRYSYLLAHGSIPDNTEIDHLCRVTLCVNPHHLEAVTHRENILRGESPAAHHARKERCRCGSDFVRKGRQRVCPVCSKVPVSRRT